MNINKITTRPGFEFLFAVGIAAIFIIPSAVMAQSSKSLEITINNGDTVINGKNIKELNPQQRMDALKDLNTLKAPKSGRREFRVERRMNNGLGIGDKAMLPPAPPDAPQYGDYTGGNKDKPLRLKRRIDTSFAYTFKLNDDDHPAMLAPMRPMYDRPEGRGRGMRGERMMGFNRRNSQTFNYTNTDKQGISTHINYSVTDPDGFNMDKAVLDINDIKLVPDFTSGKTTLMFSLPSKAAAEVEFTNGEGKILWSEKVSSQNFSKTFSLALNGRYELKVKQSGKMIVKQIMKEE